jgi:3-oxoacyl-[acyl-carrier-protein] synthase-1
MTSADGHRHTPRVVVTGMGSVSCAGTGNAALLDALQQQRSGIRFMETLAALGMRCRVGGPVDETTLDAPSRKLRRFLCATTWYAWQAMREAIAQAGLAPGELQSPHCGLVMGGGAALSEHEIALDSFRQRGIGKLSPFIVPRGMSSALAAGLAYAFDIGGRSHVVSAACTSGAHAIGQAMELIQMGKQDIVICGGSEELHDTTALWFDAMGALSVNSNERPSAASRPYDADRDGIVLAAGAGVLVLESLEHARRRGAAVIAEVCGYGASTEAQSMVGPGAEGIARAMRQALASHASPDYINTHACSTAQGDLAEWQAIEQVFRERDAVPPPMSSIKGLIGHAPGAAGALDAIAGLLMMRHDFLAAGSAIETPDPAFAEAPLVTAPLHRRIGSVLSNSFGFGGSCASLLFHAAEGSYA